MIRFTKKYVFIIMGVFAVGIIASQIFFNNGKPKFLIAEAQRGDILQTVSETGIVKINNEIELNFKNAGKIAKINVKVGDKIVKNQTLANLEANSLYIQYEEAKANIAVAQANFDKLIFGATAEELKIYETAVTNKAVSLVTAQQNLSDAYEDAINTFEDAYVKVYNALNTVKTVQTSYFISGDQASFNVIENKNFINGELSSIKSYLDSAKISSDRTKIDNNISEIRKSVNNVFDYLTTIRQLCDDMYYRDIVSSANKTSLDTQKTNINTVVANIIAAQQDIASDKLSVESAQGQLESARDDLNLEKASPRREDINLYQGQLDQAKAKLNLLASQISDSVIKSPVSGTIKSISKKEGEIVQSTSDFITLLSDEPFQIEVNIYEEDIVKLQIENFVEISLVAFPDQKFSGKVIEIDPAEKLINEVVYYRTKIAFDATPSGLKPGMSADLIIKTNFREDVLYIAKDAIIEKNSKRFVNVLDDKNQTQEREIKTGLEGSDGNVEIISGLQKGEKVIID